MLVLCSTGVKGKQMKTAGFYMVEQHNSKQEGNTLAYWFCSPSNDRTPEISLGSQEGSVA